MFDEPRIPHVAVNKVAFFEVVRSRCCKYVRSFVYLFFFFYDHFDVARSPLILTLHIDAEVGGLVSV